jgi:redox-sensitive bicupin YhaK (pirin superfamily)
MGAQLSERGGHKHYCGIDQVISGQPTSDGAGVRLTRYIGSQSLPELDPFLLLDFFESDDPNDYIAGFPSHPHRGFETVTYLLAGKMRHEDNAGHGGVIEAGGIQWMTAGQGIIHSEMPEQENGRLAGFQLWVNLPASDKLCDPAYREYPKDQIPLENYAQGVEVRVITGVTHHGTTGPISGVVTKPLYLDVNMSPEASFEEFIPQGHAGFVFVIEGEISVRSDTDSKTISTGQLGVLGPGNAVHIESSASSARFLLVAAQVLDEPIARYGPFVMNTRAEIEQAITDLNAGKF